MDFLANGASIVKACTPIANQKAWRKGVIPYSDTCDFLCRDGYIKDSSKRKCAPPDQGYYVANGLSKSCGTAPKGGAWIPQQSPDVNSQSKCIFQCGQDLEYSGPGGGSRGSFRYKTSANPSSALGVQAYCTPRQGYFISSSGAVESCGDAPEGGSWIKLQPAQVHSATECIFTCQTTHLNGSPLVSAVGTGPHGTCGVPQGSYVDASGQVQSCGQAPPDATWVARQSGVLVAADCRFGCASAYRAPRGNGPSGVCAIDLGYYLPGGEGVAGEPSLCPEGKISNNDKTGCRGPAQGKYLRLT